MFRQAVQVALKEHTLTGNASLRRLLTLILILTTLSTICNLRPRYTELGWNWKLRNDECKMLSGHHWTVNFNYSWSFDNNIYIYLWKYILISRFFQNVDIYNRKEYTTVGIVVTRVLRPSSVFCAALTFTPSAAQHREQSAVSCWQICPQSHLFSKPDNPGASVIMWPKP